jgi:two-component system response regulator ChvI
MTGPSAVSVQPKAVVNDRIVARDENENEHASDELEFGPGYDATMRPKALSALGEAESRRVVIVDSGQYYRELLTEELMNHGFAVHPFRDGHSLLGSLDIAVEADLAVLDWDLPEMSGIKLLAQLRRHGVDVPVVFLSGKVIAGDRHDQCLLAPQDVRNDQERLAFEHGALDFIAKSRDKCAMARRLRILVDLTQPKARKGLAVSDRLVGAKLLLKPDSRRAFWNHIDVGLTLGEYNVVHLLASQAGSFVTYRAIYDRLRHEGFVAGVGQDGFRANVRSAIKRIRNKFRACDLAFDEIENFTGFGYCWRKSGSPAFRDAPPVADGP